MCWFTLTPVMGDETLKSERFWAPARDFGIGRAMGTLDERFEGKGQAYAALGVTFRLDEHGPKIGAGLKLTDDSYIGSMTTEVLDEGTVQVKWLEAA